MDIRSQISMVFHLDKCIGCHTCSIACKNVWTDRKGTEYMWWNNVETKPGTGYPTRWEDQEKYKGGWQNKNDQLSLKSTGKGQLIFNIFHHPHMHSVPLRSVHTCSIACKNVWTDRKGTEYMWWNNVETKPGTGYPTRWPRGICIQYHSPERTLSVPKSPLRGNRRAGGHNSLTRTRLKPNLMVGGYGQFTYHFNYWGPTGSNRDTHILVRKVPTLNMGVSVVTRACVSARIPRGICIQYHSPERTLSVPKSPLRGNRRAGGHNSLTRTRLKPNLMVGGYGQFTYHFNYWGPTGSNRDTHILVRKVPTLNW